jgi:hypothetical protein
MMCLVKAKDAVAAASCLTFGPHHKAATAVGLKARRCQIPNVLLPIGVATHPDGGRDQRWVAGGGRRRRAAVEAGGSLGFRVALVRDFNHRRS